MTYQECLTSTFIEPESWVIFALAVIATIVLYFYKHRRGAFFCLVLGLLSGAGWAYLYYEMNCIELII